MEQLKGLPLGRQIILGLGILLLIDTFLDWQQISALGITAGQSAWHGFLGIVMGLALVVLLLWTVARAFEVDLPDQVPDGRTSLGLSVLIALFALLKALTDDAVHWPAWVGVLLALGIVYGAWLVFSASGEPLSVGSMGGSAGGSTTTSPPSSSTPPPTPPAAGDE